MQPINYMLDVADPFQKAMQGYQFGMAIRQDQQAQAQAEAQRMAAAQMQADLQAVANNPRATGADYAALATKYPQLSENFKRSFDMLSAEQQRSKLEHMGQVYAAIESGQPQFAVSALRSRAEAMRASGDEAGAKSTEDFAQLVELNPQTARNSAALMLSSAMGPEKFAETFSKLGVESRAAAEAPYELKKKQADATTAEAKAKYAESDVLLDLEKKGWDIKKVQADIQADRERNRIAAMNAAISRETNDLKRQELQIKVQEARSALDEKIRGRVAEAESGAASIDNMLNTIERVKRSKDLGDVTGSIEGRMPAFLDSGNADAIALIETLGSQAFVAQIPSIKGTGALSDAEGKKLQSALQSLDRTQSEEQFRANLDEAARLLTKARQNLSKRTGVPLAKPDTPAAPGSRPPLSSFGGG